MSKPFLIPHVAIIGSGPAALMAADRLSAHSELCRISIFDKRPGIAWKLYVAGSSGLNITNSAEASSFAAQYTGPDEHWQAALKSFSNQDWIRFLEDDLGQETFLGTSGRYFVKEMHAAKLVKAWKKRLESRGVGFCMSHDWTDLNKVGASWELRFQRSEPAFADLVIFALGGASYEKTLADVSWSEVVKSKNIAIAPFTAANSGYHVAWKEGFLKEADGLPFKNILFTNAKGSRKGDLIVTAYGLEGTPIYSLGESGPAWIDLKPDLKLKDIIEKLSTGRENLSLMRRAQKYLSLNKTALALIFHGSPESIRKSDDPHVFASLIKHFPIELLESRPLSESISSNGGIRWSELDDSLGITKLEGVYAVGEMIDWSAPTGGFLIQGAVSQGAWAASHVLEKLRLTHP